MKTEIQKYGQWYRSRVTLTRGLWQVGVCIDLLSFRVGLSAVSARSYQLDLGFFSFDVARLLHFRAL